MAEPDRQPKPEPEPEPGPKPDRRRAPRRAKRPGAPGADPTPQAVSRLREDAIRADEDTDAAWGDHATTNDDTLKRDVPPHW